MIVDSSTRRFTVAQETMFGGPRRPALPRLRLVADRVVDVETGEVLDLEAAIAELPWIRQRCPFMPHEYVVKPQAPRLAWAIVATWLDRHPASYLALWRGYQRPMRYLEHLDGRRYWRTGKQVQMVNRASSSEEPGRRVDQGAVPIAGWPGPPWVPAESTHLYFRTSDGKWWPKPDSGIAPCAACKGGPR